MCHLIPTIYGSYRAIWGILKERRLAAGAPSKWHPYFTLDELRKSETTKSRKLTWGRKPVWERNIWMLGYEKGQLKHLTLTKCRLVKKCASSLPKVQGYSATVNSVDILINLIEHIIGIRINHGACGLDMEGHQGLIHD